MTRRRTSAGPTARLAFKLAGCYIGGAVALSGIVASIMCGETEEENVAIAEFLASQTTIQTGENLCFYKSDETEMRVQLEEYKGHRFPNTLAWFFGMSTDPAIHELGALPHYKSIECDLVREDRKFDLDKFAQTKITDIEMFQNSEQFRKALEENEEEVILHYSFQPIPNR